MGKILLLIPLVLGDDYPVIEGLTGNALGLGLTPTPTLPYSILADRGEILSRGHKKTAIKFLPHTSYTPPYRGDLKGLVEVLHRIEKDAQFLFIPGAMDYRREELELRRVNPESCVFTVQEYTQYLQELFYEYNLSADRRHRLDAHMVAADVVPCPAGLWSWGHAVGLGVRRVTAESDLITEFLPSASASVRRDAVYLGGNEYTSEQVQQEQWTTLAKNLGSRQIPVHYHPISVGTIWTPDPSGQGLRKLFLSDQARLTSEATFDEWADVKALTTMNSPRESDRRLRLTLEARSKQQQLLQQAQRETAKALAVVPTMKPTMTEARQMETAMQHTSRSEKVVTESLRDEAMQEHEQLMAELLQIDGE